ncbi:hypothetical protein [uncultured Methylobacterium sp.]|uniref:hypothetical protein n=1 Tax=uncultured Methylobacterium sp. TaxID=157278 RepID=UPI0035CAA7FF
MSTLVDRPGWSLVTELRSRSPHLTAFGLACLIAAAITLCLPLFDGRQFGGVPVWLKPAKFFVSVGVFALTSAWFMGYVRPERRRARSLRIAVAMLIGAGGFELGYITLQGALGQASHFNTGDPVHGFLYALMGLGALTLLASKIPLVIEIARRPVAGMDPGLRLAVVLGLTITVVLGGGAGILISLNDGPVIGLQGARLPLFGWNLGGGDLRVGHFLGMHGEQVLPALAATAASLLPARRTVLVSLAALAWAAMTLFAIMQARAGMAFPFG